MQKQNDKNSEFLLLFGKMTANWKLDKDRQEAIASEYHKIYLEVGESRFADAVSKILSESEYSFFPTISEFRGYIASAKRKPFCGKCEEGWIRVPDYEARRMYKNETATAMIRCECRRGPGFEKYEKRVKAWVPAN